MHLIIFALILAFVLYMLVSYSRGSSSNHSSPVTSSSSFASGSGNETIAYVAGGKLFLKSPNSDVQQITSPFVQDLLKKAERRNELHSWKKGTSFDQNFVGKSFSQSAEATAMSFRTAEFVDDNTLIYFLSDGSVGGLFEYNLTTGEEKRLLHRQALDLEGFHYDPIKDQILCSSGSDNGIRNIAAFDRKTNDMIHFTEGDTIDGLPYSYPGDSSKVVMQSAGIGRNPDGYMLAVGPASLNILSIDTQQLEPVIENEKLDLMHPVVHPNGDLYYIRRPYELPRASAGATLLDIVLFPFRLSRAFFHYFNFFSLMYSQKPLTSASGPEVKRDRKELVIQGKRIDAEKGQRQAGVIRGVPSLVPTSWQLVCRNRQGQETVVANSVVSFDISSAGNVVFTNGFGVFELTTDGPSLLFRDSLIEELLVS